MRRLTILSLLILSLSTLLLAQRADDYFSDSDEAGKPRNPNGKGKSRNKSKAKSAGNTKAKSGSTDDDDNPFTCPMGQKLINIDFADPSDPKTTFVPVCGDFQRPQCAKDCVWGPSCRRVETWKNNPDVTAERERFGKDSRQFVAGREGRERAGGAKGRPRVSQRPKPLKPSRRAGPGRRWRRIQRWQQRRVKRQEANITDQNGVHVYVAGVREAGEVGGRQTELFCCRSPASAVQRECRWFNLPVREANSTRKQQMERVLGGKQGGFGAVKPVVRDYRWLGDYRRGVMMVEICQVKLDPQIEAECVDENKDNNEDNKDNDNNDKDNQDNQDQKDQNDQNDQNEKKNEVEKKKQGCQADWLAQTLCTALGVGLGVPLALIWCIDPVVLFEMDTAALLIESVTYDTGAVAYTGTVATFTCQSSPPSFVNGDGVTTTQTCECLGVYYGWTDFADPRCDILPCLDTCSQIFVDDAATTLAHTYVDTDASTPITQLEDDSTATAACTGATYQLSDSTAGAEVATCFETQWQYGTCCPNAPVPCTALPVCEGFCLEADVTILTVGTTIVTSTTVDAGATDPCEDLPELQPGSTITIECEVGYVVRSTGSLVATCQADGTWDFPTLECVPSCDTSLVTFTYTTGQGTESFVLPDGTTTTDNPVEEGTQATLTCIGDNGCQCTDGLGDATACPSTCGPAIDQWSTPNLQCECDCDATYLPTTFYTVAPGATFTLIPQPWKDNADCNYAFTVGPTYTVTYTYFETEPGADTVHIEDLASGTFLASDSGSLAGLTTTTYMCGPPCELNVWYETDGFLASDGAIITVTAG